MNWTDNSANESGFAIQRSTDGVNFTNLTNVAADVLTYTDNTVAPNTTYYYRVFAFNAVEDSDFSNVVQVTTGTASVSEMSLPSVRCYPNPAKDNLTLEGLSGSESIVRRRSPGEIVLERATSQETIPVDLFRVSFRNLFSACRKSVPNG
ncbi:MAG: fibronectin type III domain-containing protein [Crocinitomicaceae bacterium]